MSTKERDRLKVLHAAQKRHITQVQAAKELGISARWVRVLLRRVQAGGDGAVVHRLRGLSSNRPGAWCPRFASFLWTLTWAEEYPRRGAPPKPILLGWDQASSRGNLFQTVESIRILALQQNQSRRLWVWLGPALLPLFQSSFVDS